MFLSRIKISNFRNFHEIDVRLGSTTVVVGENNVGKSNLLFALRLVLDPRIADSTRLLRQEDFWDGLVDPIKNNSSIEIVVEFEDFQGDKNILAVLQPYLVAGSGVDDLALAYEIVHGTQGLIQRRLRVPVMQQIQVDAVGAKSLQAALHLAHDVIT